MSDDSPERRPPLATTPPLEVIYCTYRSAELAVRERLAFGSDQAILDAHEQLRQRFPGHEHVLVSTCNRVEVYLAGEAGAVLPSRQDVAAFLASFHGVQVDLFLDDLLRAEGPQAARHLFEVAASVDSMVVGESQIVQQVKAAYELATKGAASGPVMHALFQRALKVAARVRSETSLSEGRLSVASVAVGEFARQIFHNFADKRVLVVGAGEMARETVQYLQNEGARDLVVCNRSPDRAATLAAEIGGRAASFDALSVELSHADIVVAATGASQPVITRATFAAACQRRSRAMLLLDLGAPRDIEPSIVDCGDEVFLYNVDDLQATCEANRRRRAREIARATSIIDEETDRFVADMLHRSTGPIIRELRQSWKDVSDAEVEQLLRRLPHLSDGDRVQIERTIHRIVGKLLHPPLQAIREDAEDSQTLVDAVRRLFGLSS